MYVSCCHNPKIYLYRLCEKGNQHLQTGCVCCLLKIISWITNVLFMKETSKLPFLTRREQGRTREHSDVRSATFQQKSYFFIKNNLLFYFVLVHMFAIFQNTSPMRVFERNTFWRKVRNYRQPLFVFFKKHHCRLQWP